MTTSKDTNPKDAVGTRKVPFSTVPASTVVPMAVEKKITEVSEYDLAYAAGLIDGEGCISLYRNSHNGNFQLRITVEMCEREGLDVLAAAFGGRWYFKNKKPPRRPTFVWMSFNSEAETALGLLLPYLRVKRRQAHAALQADWHSFAKRKMCPDQQELRTRIAEEIRGYNARGTMAEGSAA